MVKKKTRLQVKLVYMNSSCVEVWNNLLFVEGGQVFGRSPLDLLWLFYLE